MFSFYCDYCKNTHKMNILDPNESNLCEVTGKRTFTAEVEVCPPAEKFNSDVCSAFTKDLEYINNVRNYKSL